MPRALALAAALVLLAAAPLASAQERIVFDFEGAVGEDGVPRPWSFKRWAPMVGLGKTFEAAARVVVDEGQKALHVRSVKSGFIVGRKRDVDVSVYRHVSWRWKAETLPRGGDFRRRATNDQALQLLFGFEGGKVVGYIWDTVGPLGASGSGLAFREDVRVIVVESGKGKAGRWIAEKRNLYEDYQRLFETPPPLMKGVAIQSNSQHSGSEGAGLVGPIALTKI